jgi:hypothetical protein
MEAGLACDSYNKGVYEAFGITNQCCGSGSRAQDSGSGAFFYPESRMWDGKSPESGDPRSGMKIPDRYFEHLVSVFWVENRFKKI